MGEAHMLEGRIEILKQETHAYLKQMYYFNDTIYKKIQNIKPLDLIKPENNRLRGEVMDWVIGIRKIATFFRSELSRTCLSRQVTHDLRGLGASLDTSALYVFESLKSNSSMDLEDEFPVIIKAWPFYFSVVEDVLLRGLDEKKVEKIFVGVLDLERMRDSLCFLDEKEKKTWENSERQAVKFGKPSRGAYPFLFVEGTNFDEIRKRLDIQGRTVVGNTGVITNFLSNAISNALKDRIQAKRVLFEINMDRDELVLRVKDDGKGMLPENLDENHQLNETIRRDNKEREENGERKLYTYYIFEEGASGDSTDLEKKKSTGLGLANLDKRLASIKGILRVVTRRKETSQETHFSNKDDEDYLPELQLDTDHGTIFELRLPIVDKKTAKF